MLHSLRQVSTNFLGRPIGAGVLVGLLALVTLLFQTQPWGLPERVLLAALPSLVPAAILFVLHPRSGRLSGKGWATIAAALLLWVLLFADIGWPFLSWFLVFGAALMAVAFVAPRPGRALAAGMILFAGFYLTLRLHQLIQLGYLQLRVAIQARSEEARIAARLEGNQLLVEQDGRPVLTAGLPDHLSVRTGDTETGFAGLHPLILFSSDPADERALPLVALLAVPPAFPPALWNIQLESTLAGLRRDGRIGEPKAAQRKGKCGDMDCSEVLWVYEDRFHARRVQTGYALIPLQTASKADGSAPEPLTLMLWFREPFVEGLPHSPAVLDFVKGFRRAGLPVTVPGPTSSPNR